MRRGPGGAMKAEGGEGGGRHSQSSATEQHAEEEEGRGGVAPVFKFK